MKFKSALVTSASGSAGGLTASRNRGGLYLRSRTVPVNPNTERQGTVRNAMAQLAVYWTQTMNQFNRDGWDAYAEAVPLPDTLGEPRNVGGLAMYQRSNIPRLQAGLDRVDAAPSTLALPEPPISLSATIGPGPFADNGSLSFAFLDDWVNQDGAALLVLMRKPVSTRVNTPRSSSRFALAVLGDSTTPPTSPVLFTTPWPTLAGQKVRLEARVSLADGRLSNRLSVDVITA